MRTILEERTYTNTQWKIVFVIFAHTPPQCLLQYHIHFLKNKKTFITYITKYNFVFFECFVCQRRLDLSNVRSLQRRDVLRISQTTRMKC